MNIREVYKATNILKQKLLALFDRLEDGQLVDKECFLPKGRLLRKEDPVVHEAVRDYLQLYGIYKLTLKSVQNHIALSQPQQKPLRLNDIQEILRKQYHLDYRHLNPADFRYRDPAFNEKRVWVSRLLT